MNVAPSPEVFAIMTKDADELSTESEKAKERIAELESVETIIVSRHKELVEEDLQRLTEEVRVWKEASGENAGSLIIDANVAKADSFKMSVARNLIPAHSENHVRCSTDSDQHERETEREVDGRYGEDPIAT